VIEAVAFEHSNRAFIRVSGAISALMFHSELRSMTLRVRCLAITPVLAALIGCSAGSNTDVFDSANDSADAGGASGGSSSVSTGGSTTVSTGGSGASTAPGTGGTTNSGGTTSTGGGPPLGGNVLLFDDFEDGNTDGWIANRGDGDEAFGNWAVVSDATGHVYEEQSVFSDPSFAVGGDLAWTDQQLEVKVRLDGDVSDATIFLAVRFQSWDNYYFLEFHGDGRMKIRASVGGSTADVVSYDTDTPLTSGTWYSIGLSAKGSTLNALLDGAVVATGMDDRLTNGGIALAARDVSAAFDDVKVTVP
jgi:hypothetical protein